MYASDRPERCPVCIILKYMALLPKTRSCQAFYLQPRKKYFGKSWYLNRPCGVNKLRDIVGSMCQDAGLPGHNTNHSLRWTAATKMYQKDIDEQLIMEVTGHRSTAVRRYKRTSRQQRKAASRCIFSDWLTTLTSMTSTLHWVIWYVTCYIYCYFCVHCWSMYHCSLLNTPVELSIVVMYWQFVENNSQGNTKGKPLTGVYERAELCWDISIFWFLTYIKAALKITINLYLN